MARKRMFSPDIVESDAFIEMPVSSQVLYFHLAMRADDDGFVNPNITMRMVGANNDDIKILLAKRFILKFDSGVVVVKHWRINNFIRRDRYKATNYTDEKKLLRVKENMAYTLDEKQGLPIDTVVWKSDSEARSTIGQPNVIPLVDVGKVRLGKDSKDNYGEFKNVFLDKEEHIKLCERYGRGAVSKLVEDLSTYLKSSGSRYKDHYATILNWARRKAVVEVSRGIAPAVIAEKPLSPDEQAKIRGRMNQIGEKFSIKKTV